MSENSNALDWDLKGVHIIEASAGTGKTYNIQTLFARQIIEEAIPVDAILVVTFTEAATKELIDRIRRILKDLLNYIKTGQNNSGEERIPAIVKRAKTRNQTSEKIILKRIDDALKNFDDAAIFTIHGFCNRMLKDAAFETGTLFDTVLCENTDEIMEDVLADFYRENFYDASEFTNKLLEAQKLRLKDLRRFVSDINENLEPHFIPRDVNLDINPAIIAEQINRINKYWDRDSIWDELSGKMNKGYRKSGFNKKSEKIFLASSV